MAVRSSTLRSDIGLIEAQGAFLGGGEVDDLRQAIKKFIDSQCPKLIIDLGGVTHMNSTAVGVLVGASVSYTRRQWQMRICGVNKVVYAIMAITKLNLILDLTDTVDDAIQSFT
jgi:anti-anti-sigma factor